MPKFHIDEVYPSSETNPIILNFQNGYTTDKFKSKNCVLLDNERSGKKVVAVELNELVYAGETAEKDLGKTLILAKNRKTGKVRLIEVTTAELKPVLNIENEVSKLLETSGLELSRKFGSKKQKQQMEQKEKLKVNVETVTEQMSILTESITEDKLDLTVYNKNDSDDFYIPPIDRTAAKPEHVYDIDKILTEEQYEQIYSEIEHQDYKTDMLPVLKDIINQQDLSQKKAVLAAYADCLLKLFLTAAKFINIKAFKACTYSDTLNKILMTNFIVNNNGKRFRPTPYKDKALCHAVVCILLLNNLKFELEDFCRDTKLTPNTASTKIRVTGATVVNTGGKKVVHLKLPLNTKTSFRRKSTMF